MNKKIFAECTKHPGLFRNTYWGMNLGDQPDIFNNRNRFVEQFKLKNRWHRPSAAVHFWYALAPELDHPEEYRTEDGGVVLVTSPYHRKMTPSSGWELYDKLYAPNAESYIRVFDSPQALRKEACDLIDNIIGKIKPAHLSPSVWKRRKAHARRVLLTEAYAVDIIKVIGAVNE